MIRAARRSGGRSVLLPPARKTGFAREDSFWGLFRKTLRALAKLGYVCRRLFIFMKLTFLSLVALTVLNLTAFAGGRGPAGAEDSPGIFQKDFFNLKESGDGKKGESPMAKALKGKTVKLSGDHFKPYNISSAKRPDYYLIYWGASWCGPCQASAPDLVKLYNKNLASSSRVELVHVSFDRGPEGMKSFMGKHKMKFPAVEPADARSIGLLGPLTPSSIPSYKLVDSKGRVIAEGYAAKQKAVELARKK